MDTINEGLRIIGNVISGMRWSDVVDILIITFIIYKLLSFVRRTSEKSNSKGLYYISRVFGSKETTLYLGIATKNNTIRHRLKGHKSWWLKEYRGTIKVRIGKVIYPHTNIDEVIDHAESAILYEQGKLFFENTSKTKSYTYNTVYSFKNIGDIFELKPFIDMAEQK